ncbi:MAG: GGDEF domain-containing protein, partial [Trueperaceae bacterium]
SRREAVTDPLTDLLNRRGAEAELTRALARAERSGRPMSLVMIDLGSFKRINDTYGHDAGDRALRRVAETLRNASRTGDLVARWGGDEFLVLLPHQGSADAVATAERLVQAVRSVREGDAVVEAHAGTASFPDDGADLDALVRRADARMYEHKRSV